LLVFFVAGNRQRILDGRSPFTLKRSAFNLNEPHEASDHT